MFCFIMLYIVCLYVDVFKYVSFWRIVLEMFLFVFYVVGKSFYVIVSEIGVYIVFCSKDGRYSGRWEWGRR